ncbi:DUF427 domain-containing protein [Plastorhodobacter daqingensis]|uniref:DUF427 domain-containing protein n=1 Tax=Plastorhodobacter daqingensis TaxID=1387281 RepID=A0ABW2UJC3_9RHOB
MPDQIKIQKAEGTWVVRAGGAVLGESQAALEVTEGRATAAIYFPRTDVAMAFLDRSDSRTICPRKGAASYYNLVTKSTTINDACWSYEDPKPLAEELRDYLSFFPDRVTVEQI